MYFSLFQTFMLLLLITPDLSCMEPEMFAEPASNNLMVLCTQLSIVQTSPEKTMLYKKFAQSYIENQTLFAKSNEHESRVIRETITKDTSWLDQLSENILLTSIDDKELASSNDKKSYSRFPPVRKAHIIYPKKKADTFNDQKRINTDAFLNEYFYYLTVPCGIYTKDDKEFTVEIFNFSIENNAFVFNNREYASVKDLATSLSDRVTLDEAPIDDFNGIKLKTVPSIKILENLYSYEKNLFSARNGTHLFSWNSLTTEEDKKERTQLSLFNVKKTDEFIHFIQQEATLEQMACITSLIYNYQKTMAHMQSSEHTLKTYNSLTLSDYFLTLQPRKGILEKQMSDSIDLIITKNDLIPDSYTVNTSIKNKHSNSVQSCCPIL